MEECDTLYKITFPHQPAHAQCQRQLNKLQLDCSVQSRISSTRIQCTLSPKGTILAFRAEGYLYLNQHNPIRESFDVFTTKKNKNQTKHGALVNGYSRGMAQNDTPKSTGTSIFQDRYGRYRIGPFPHSSQTKFHVDSSNFSEWVAATTFRH